MSEDKFTLSRQPVPAKRTPWVPLVAETKQLLLLDTVNWERDQKPLFEEVEGDEGNVARGTR